jgi:hypothetical protein
VDRATGNKVLVFASLIGLAIASRLVMALPNLHAVTAATLFAGFYFRNRLVAALVPFVAMTVSNWIIGGYAWPVMITVYAAMLMPLAFRGLLLAKLSATRVAGSAMISTAVFYLATNGAVWLTALWYPRTLEGLVACYVAALPFAANALLGDLAFSAILFGAYAAAKHLPSPRLIAARAAS